MNSDKVGLIVGPFGAGAKDLITSDVEAARSDSRASRSLPSLIHVVAGALFDTQGRVLIAQRPAGKHMAGSWEFPGGKLNAGEERLAGLKRELSEELGIAVLEAAPVIAYEHSYMDRHVRLDLWAVARFEGKPQSLEGQALRWVEVAELEDAGLLEADRPMVRALLALRG